MHLPPSGRPVRRSPRRGESLDPFADDDVDLDLSVGPGCTAPKTSGDVTFRFDVE